MTAELAHDAVLRLGAVLPIFSKMPRAVLVAGPDKKFVGGDWSNIQGRINAWIAGEEWKLRAFRDYDAGTGPDLYRATFAATFGMRVDDVDEGRGKGPQRQVGKTMELALGFQGSLGAWLRFDPKPAIVTALVREREFNSERWREAAEQFDKSTRRFGLTPDEWISIKLVVNGWREANSAIAQSWWDLQDAAVAAVDQPETLIPVLGGRVGYMVTEGFLCCRLPTGKILYYCRPRLVETREDFLVDEEGELIALDELGEDEVAARVAAGATIREGRSRTQVQFDGPHPKTGRMCSQRLYGGLQNNHVVQGLEVEILKPAMARVKAAGYPIVLETYDSIMSEVDAGFGSPAEFEALMAELAPELAGLPLASKAWENVRYVE